MSDETPQQNPKWYKEASETSPELSPKAPNEEKGDPLSRRDASREPAENEETRRGAERLEKEARLLRRTAASGAR